MTVLRIRTLLVLALLMAASATSTLADEPLDRAGKIRANYTKYEYRVPMRDGVKLFTSVYVPNDTSTDHPILMVRTPYSVGPYGADRYKSRLGPTEAFEDDNYIFVFQDARGCYMSEGEFLNMRPHASADGINEATDTYDTIDWLLANIEGHNGRVGQWGVSYPGFYTSAGVIDSHPALKAVSPQAPISDWFWDDMHHHGAFVLPLAFRFFSTFGLKREGPTTERGERGFEFGTPDGYQFYMDMGPLSNANEKYFKGEIDFWNKIVEHPNYDEFWQSRNILPHLKNVSSAVMVVGGWFDTEDLYGPLKTYRSIEEKNPGIHNTIVMGPWSHGAWVRSPGDSLGDADFGFRTSDFYNRQVVYPYFDHFLNDGEEPDLPEAMMFETGANRWRRFDEWPPAARRARSLYFREDGGLSFEVPAEADDTTDSYVSDPEKPVPYTAEIASGWTRGYMAEDQRFAARRPDVLVYQTDVLEDDLTFAGSIQANLFVSTTGTDSDWVVKVIDVYPGEVPGYSAESGEPNRGGQQTLVRAEVFRGRFRNSYETPEPFVPGEVTEVSFELQDVLHTFKRGHRVMVQVQSSWFPFIDRNPQRYVPNIFEATEDDFIEVTNTIHRSSEHPSHIAVGVLGRD